MKVLVMHVGDFKTGSTSLQLALGNAASKGHCRDEEVCYCMAGGEGFRGHHSLANEIKGFDYLKGTWQKLGGEIKNSPFSNYVVSSEALWAIPPANIKEMLDQYLDGIHLKIVIYLRPHHSRILAAYTQKVKTGQLLDDLTEFVQEAVASRDYEYVGKVEHWQQTFSEAEFIVRPFIPDLMIDSDIIRDFCVHGLGVEGGYLDSFRAAETNETPSLEILDIMQCYTRVLNPQQHWKRANVIEGQLLGALRDALSEVFPKEAGHVLKLSVESCDLIREALASDAHLVDQKFFEGSGIFTDTLNNYQGKEPLGRSVLTEKDLQVHTAYAKLLKDLCIKQ